MTNVAIAQPQATAVKPLAVSVVIPTYNCARYLGKALDSVRAQTCVPSEIIVVDDGSSDDTASVVQAYKPAVTYLRQDNRGEPAARNLGVLHAKSELIAFLDSDDFWLPDKLALQIAYLQKHPECALVYSDMQTFDENGVIDQSVKERFNISFPKGNIFAQLFQETIFGSGSVLIRKQCFQEVGLFDEALLVGSDYEMWLRIARHFPIGYVDKPLLMYRQHTGMSTRSLGRVLQEGMPWEVVVLKKILARYPDTAKELGSAWVNRRLAKPYACMGHTLLGQSDHANARRMFHAALRLWPGNRSYWLFYLATFARPRQLAGFRKVYSRFQRWRAAGASRPAGGLPVSAA